MNPTLTPGLDSFMAPGPSLPQPAGVSPAEFMAAARPGAGVVQSGNTPWAQRYAGEIRRVLERYAARAPRTLQRHLGPSEIGEECDRQVAGKLAGLPALNHVADPWPSMVGTALHSYAEGAFQADNQTRAPRWLTERRVHPHPDHPGTTDLYDAVEQSVDDHKFLGEHSLRKVRSPEGPPRRYVVQLLLYGRGVRRLGLPVRRVALLAYPRTGASLSGLYVWEREHTPADDELLAQVFDELDVRKRWAAALLTGQAGLRDVPATPGDGCYFCPFYRPATARDGGPGCPGHVTATPLDGQR